jgi:alkyldihydroxyacetonephosphate synthase
MSQTSNLVKQLSSQLGKEVVLADAESIDARRHDYWVLSHVRRRMGQLGDPPACVVRPTSAADVAATLAVAREHRAAVVPYGAGSGVCGGVLAPAGSIVLDLSGMDRIVSLNETALSVTVQAGMRGDVFEAALGERGYTMGHFPQSIALSTVGGWVATRASGQFSTRYGNIEDMLIGFEGVLASGEIVRLPASPRRSTGPDPSAIFLGSEGTLGVLTELTFRIHPQPDHREMASFAFADMSAGLEAIRRVMRAGWRPAVLRLYDDVESARHFTADSNGRCMLLVLGEGPEAGVAAEARGVGAIMEESGGTPCGAGAVASWLEHRNAVPSWDQLLDQGIIADTIEIAVPWDRAAGVYDDAVAKLKQIPGLLMASGHSSHSYGQGTCLYLTLVAKLGELADAPALYERCWDAVMDTTVTAGGTISHHHGIGRVRRRWLARELGSAYAVLRTLKRAFDPDGILNPGVLLENG